MFFECNYVVNYIWLIEAFLIVICGVIYVLVFVLFVFRSKCMKLKNYKNVEKL